MSAIKNMMVVPLLVLFMISGLISCGHTPMKISPDPLAQENRKKSALVFVHGVLGDPRTTWENDSSQRWPDRVRNEKKLKGKYDVYEVSYETSFGESPVIFQLGEDLNCLLGKKKIFPKCLKDLMENNTNQEETTLYEDVIFVAHSMGNLVVASALLTGPPDLERKVPLLLSIAAPWAGSALSEHAWLLFFNPQFNDMQEIQKNSFLQLLDNVWKRNSFPVRVECAWEGSPYLDFPGEVWVVRQPSIATPCEGEKVIKGEHHSSIVKPVFIDNEETPDIHSWLIDLLNKLEESKELKGTRGSTPPPWKLEEWKLQRWVGEKVTTGMSNGETVTKNVRRIVIAGKDFIESNILMEMMAQVIEQKIVEKKIGEEIKVVRKSNLGNGPFVLSQLQKEEIDIYAEYSGALLYSYLGKDAQEAEETKHLPRNINLIMSSYEHPDFRKMKLLPTFGFDSSFELIMLKSTAEKLGILEKVDQDNSYVLLSNLIEIPIPLEVFGDRDLFHRRDALGGLKTWLVDSGKISVLDNVIESPLIHDYIYPRLDGTDCSVNKNEQYCQNGVVSKVGLAIGFKTDPIIKNSKYVEVVSDKGFEFPKHMASPMVHRFLDNAFQDLKPADALGSLEGKVSNKEMLGLIIDVEDWRRKFFKECEKDKKRNRKQNENSFISETCNFQEAYERALRERVKIFLDSNGVFN